MQDEMTPNAPTLGDVRQFCKRTWWMFLISGIAALVFGILAFAKPGVAFLVLSIWFAIFLLVDGVSNLAGALSHRDKDGWVLAAVMGVLGILIGGYLLLVPPVSMVAFVYTVAFFAMVVGITLVSLGWKIRKETTREWVLYLNGILSIIFSLLLFFRVEIGGLTLVYIIAFWAVVIGLLRIVFALKARSLVRDVKDAVGG
ncbi:hypothetical protein F3N42_00230 [Marinihelvus fidelis]|uniref:HdeD family acid-resistance protein n=1 Tax=Marinihelvus fidelis TaxID=2613842 RepID=A0A5N0TG12_9GAMM|nr:DUF308 domain-containing protein [Marinihelvus fidelis]KAA9134015.1 hypothetical protein F3N42_00230 [Marinihelvus fidelis]